MTGPKPRATRTASRRTPGVERVTECLPPGAGPALEVAGIAQGLASSFSDELRELRRTQLARRNAAQPAEVSHA